jgi:hypothetical protein
VDGNVIRQEVAWNASDSIRVNRESDSNETDESDSHDEKHPEQTISTFRGMTIDSITQFANPRDSICFNPEFDSNSTVANDQHQQKHDAPTISTFRGITID